MASNGGGFRRLSSLPPSRKKEAQSYASNSFWRRWETIPHPLWSRHGFRRRSKPPPDDDVPPPAAGNDRQLVEERASARFDQGTSQFVSSNPINREMSRSTSRPSLNGNERLPGAVLLARARLLERLRGVSISPNRRSGRISFGGYQEENIFGDELRLVEAGDWGAETSTGSSTRGSPFAEFTAEIERLQIMQEAKRKKPPGLTKEALDCLHVEVFNNYEIGMEAELAKAALDCSICLESFVDGDELIRLPCQHRFHSACLDPWVRSCGDCPYCRRDILVNSHKAIERT